MIKRISIKNFKSVYDLSLDLGRFNVLIGENGCGKSNILEAIAFGAAASADKLDNEFLGSRGIRVTNADFMFSAFATDKIQKSIKIKITDNERTFVFNLINKPINSKKWINKSKEETLRKIDKVLKVLLFDEDEKKKEELINSMNENAGELSVFSELIKPYKDENGFKNFFSNIFPTIIEKFSSHPDISNYIIYSPEQSRLRKFEETTQIYPLGVRGEGLFQYLKELAFDKKNNKILNQIKNNLLLLDWYEDFDLPENLLKNEFSLNIKDRFIKPELQYFDQRSTNEGFLYLLYYSTLFISSTTPVFFAIDNIDSSLNPKLCMELTKNLATLTLEHEKQVIITTHNPAVLDGLNLNDDNQRLFVVRRNDDGHTIAKRIEYKKEREKKLSELWTNGYIGGLPENF